MSHETIYKCLYVQARGSLRADLQQRLSTKRASTQTPGPIDGARRLLQRRRIHHQRAPLKPTIARYPGTGKAT